MTTLLLLKASDGREFSCDGRCYLAKTEKCSCVCGGDNHGVGLDSACEITRQNSDKMVERFCKLVGIGDYDAFVNTNVVNQFRFNFVQENEQVTDAIPEKRDLGFSAEEVDESPDIDFTGIGG